ncbi:MAG: hypothetical protein QOE88_2145, partial [Verrucomicrobiota bacterium]|nr:hypothetical protein [Verrucomicrobiota bacterium]
DVELESGLGELAATGSDLLALDQRALVAAGPREGWDVLAVRLGGPGARGDAGLAGHHLHNPHSGYRAPIPSTNRALNEDQVKGAGPSCSGEGWKFLNPIMRL